MISRHFFLIWILSAGLLAGTAEAVTCGANTPTPSNPDAAYTDNGDGTVTHTPSNLTWKRCVQGQNWTDGSCFGFAEKYTWAEALSLAASHSYAGKSDWRLPNLKELRSLVEECRNSPSINDTIFPAAPTRFFWTSSTSASDSFSAWNIGFDSGTDGQDAKFVQYAVRLVRGGSYIPSTPTTPVCTLNVTTAGSVSTLTASCSPAATSYTWTGGTCASTTGDICTVTPTTTTTYTVAGTNSAGTGTPASATVTVGTSSCTYTLDNSAVFMVAGASSGSVGVSTSSACAWTAASNASWITITSNTPLSGSNTVSYVIAANTGTTARTGTITVAGQTFTVVQAAGSVVAVPVCSLTASPASITTGGSSTLTATCSPAASSYTWTGGTCSGVLGSTCTVSPTATTTYTVAGTNSGGTGTAAGATVTVSNAACTYTLTPTSASLGAAASSTGNGVSVRSSPSTCAWTATSNDSWITITGNTSGSGNNNIFYAVTANSATTQRIGTLTIAGQLFTVTQAGSTATVTYPLSVDFSGTGYGAITSDPVGISCGKQPGSSGLNPSECTKNYASGTNVTLTAIPASDSTFAGWSGACTGTGSCTVSMTEARNVAAAFSLTPPVCTLSANPPSIAEGLNATLTAQCTPAATSYIWTGGTCAGTSGSTCTVKPTVTTTYSVQGSNAAGTNQAVSATVTVTMTSYTVPGTPLGNDVFVLTSGNNHLGYGGNDTYIISPNTLRANVTAKIIDVEGDDIIQLVDGLTVTASQFLAGDAVQLMLSNGAKVQILGASRFKFQLGANALAGDTADIMSYAQFATALGASLTTLPASGTAGYVVPTGFTPATAPIPAVTGSATTVPGTLVDDVLVPSGGNNYQGGGGNDTYIISPFTLSGSVTAKIIDTEGANVIQLVNGLTIAKSDFFNNAVQLMLSNGAIVQILGASGFSYQLGANTPAGETANSLAYAQFATTLGASVPAAGATAVSGTTNFVVQKAATP